MTRRDLIKLAALSVLAPIPGAAPAAEGPTPGEASQALLRAVRFFHGHVARHGGYVYAYSADLKLREGEGDAGADAVWVQPPGTPSVGEAFLDAYDATGESACLDAARDAAHALVNGQLHSGGWNYRIDFDPQRRAQWAYRFDPGGRALPDPVREVDRKAPAGWDEWKKRKYKGNVTTLDDDTTQAATRFLVRFDRVTVFKDQRASAAAKYALASLLGAQYPNGAWSASYDRFPAAGPPADPYPIRPAQYPEAWARTWPKDFTGCYVTNDNLIADAIDTMLLAADVYGEKTYLASARRAGDFLLLAQMPDPQPAWAQQYDAGMHPVWSRAFEPPAVSGGESQGIMEALIRLHRATGEEKYLKPIPRALAYLRRSLRPDGRLARFYELETNRPIYFERDREKGHQLTYDDSRLAGGYGYVVDSRLDRIEAEYRKALREGKGREKPRVPKLSPEKIERARGVITAMDARGAWVEKGRLRHHEVEPEGGIIDSRTFVRNVRVLCEVVRR